MDATPPMSYPREKGSPVYALPLTKEGPNDFFPAVCLQSHWDPTAILKRTLPAGYVPQPTDPRPWTRVCMEYTTAGEQVPAPDVNPNIDMPGGGQFYPPGRYAAAIDNESKLRWLDRPLGTCDEKQWKPNMDGDMYDSRMLVPDRVAPSDPSKIQELAYPRALLRAGPYECRAQDDNYNTSVSSDFMFNNATKQDRYKVMKKPTKPPSPEGPLSAAPENVRHDLTFNAGPALPPDNRPGSYEGTANKQRGEMIANAVSPTNLIDRMPTNPGM